MRNALTLKLFLTLCAGAHAGAFTCALAGAAAPALAASPAAAAPALAVAATGTLPAAAPSALVASPVAAAPALAASPVAAAPALAASPVAAAPASAVAAASPVAAAPALAASPVPAPAAATALFCTRPATTLKYERREAATATLWWTHTESIDAVHANADGSLSLDVTSVIVSDIGKSPLKAPVHSVVKVHANGTVEVDAAEAAKQAAENMFSALDFKSSGGSSLLPADIKPGDTLPEIHAAVTWAIVSLTIDYTARKVLRRETITVPAGTFDCIVVQESKSERAPFHRRDRVTLTWYAPGYGMIRHDTLLPDLTPETSEVLVEVIK